MMFLKYICVVSLLVSLCAAQGVNDESRIYKVKAQHDGEIREIIKISEELKLNLLREADGASSTTHIIVQPDKSDELEKRLKKLGTYFSVAVHTIKEIIKPSNSLVSESPMEWTQYHSLDSIYEWLDQISLNHSSVVKPYTIGHSYEGRPIKALKISRRAGRKAVFVECNIHAMEWIASAACTCFINKLLNSDDVEVRKLTWDLDWIFVPMLNPDGYEYTHKVSRIWRKNRRPNGEKSILGDCIGVDMNRNWNTEWKTAGSLVDSPCLQFYAGSEPESEPEIQAEKSFINSFDDGYIRAFLAVHSFGNMVLLPHGYTDDIVPPNYNQMLNISKGWADNAVKKYGTNFTYGTSGQLLNPVSGSSKDWAYSVKGIPFSCTLELRDKGEYNFFLPALQIIPVCEEFTDGFIGMMRAAAKEKLFD